MRLRRINTPLNNHLRHGVLGDSVIIFDSGINAPCFVDSKRVLYYNVRVSLWVIVGF